MCHVACAPRGRQLAALRRHVRARGCALRDLDLAPDAYDLRDADECRAFFARAYANGTAWPVTTNNQHQYRLPLHVYGCKIVS